MSRCSCDMNKFALSAKTIKFNKLGALLILLMCSKKKKRSEDGTLRDLTRDFQSCAQNVGLRLLENHSFKTLRLICVISSFYKAFVQFSARSTELILK